MDFVYAKKLKRYVSLIYWNKRVYKRFVLKAPSLIEAKKQANVLGYVIYKRLQHPPFIQNAHRYLNGTETVLEK